MGGMELTRSGRTWVNFPGPLGELPALMGMELTEWSHTGRFPHAPEHCDAGQLVQGRLVAFLSLSSERGHARHLVHSAHD